MSKPTEGTTRTTREVYVRHECNCGKPATWRHTYVLPSARTNPRSAAYGKDDISWCADEEAYTCETCAPPSIGGLEWCASFSGERFVHMLHDWVQVSRVVELPDEGEATA